MASDFHAHHPKPGARTLVSCRMEELKYYPLPSLELHPWNLPERFEPLPEEFRAALGRAAALGEIGLDRLRGPAFAVQVEYLEALLALVDEWKKPVVFHCVRAAEELTAAMKRHPGIRGLYHGFRGKPELLEKLRGAGFYLALGPASLHDAALYEHLKTAGLERIGFETDDSPEPLAALLERAAALLGTTPGALEAQTDQTFAAFLG